MTPDDATTCLNAIQARWRYQPMSDDERKAWLRTLRRLDLATFGAALDTLAEGSALASQPGQRPSVSEFLAAAQGVKRQRLRAEHEAQRTADPWPQPTPELTSRRLAEIRAQNPQCWPECRRAAT